VRVMMEARSSKFCPVARQVLQESLQAQGVETGIHYPIPCHLQPAFKYLGYREGDFPHAEQLSEEMLSLPMYPGLTEAQVNRVVGSLTNALAVPLPVKLSA
jgi:dTDP-4-amino-4,6-dideoxygalactose transaminase